MGYLFGFYAAINWVAMRWYDYKTVGLRPTLDEWKCSGRIYNAKVMIGWYFVFVLLLIHMNGMEHMMKNELYIFLRLGTKFGFLM
jgi:hypothetical protein